MLCLFFCRITWEHFPTIHIREIQTKMKNFDDEESIQETRHICSEKRQLGVDHAEKLRSEEQVRIEKEGEDSTLAKAAAAAGSCVGFHNHRRTVTVRWKTNWRGITKF